MLIELSVNGHWNLINTLDSVIFLDIYLHWIDGRHLQIYLSFEKGSFEIWMCTQIRNIAWIVIVT